MLGFKTRGKDYLLSGLGLPPIPVVTGFYEPGVSQLSVAWNREVKHYRGLSQILLFKQSVLQVKILKI